MLDAQSIRKFDSKNILGSIEAFGLQCQAAWSETKKIFFPTPYKHCSNIVLFGMGGSALGMDVARALYADQLTVPVTIVNDYHTPACVNNKTLVFLSSYSGSTEEPLKVSETILNKTKNVCVIASGRELVKFAKLKKLPSYIIEARYNPSSQPRLAVGYAIFGLLGILQQLGYLVLGDADIKKAMDFINPLHKKFGLNVKDSNNLSKKLAVKMRSRMPILISSEFLEGATHVFANQLNENSKHFNARFPIPELNHHLLEGLSYPPAVKSKMLVVMFVSRLYHKRNIARYEITRQIVSKLHIASVEIKMTGRTPLEQVLELLLFGSYTSFFLAILHKLDPAKIPYVDFFKKQLADFEKSA